MSQLLGLVYVGVFPNSVNQYLHWNIYVQDGIPLSIIKEPNISVLCLIAGQGLTDCPGDEPPGGGGGCHQGAGYPTAATAAQVGGTSTSPSRSRNKSKSRSRSRNKSWSSSPPPPGSSSAPLWRPLSSPWPSSSLLASSLLTIRPSLRHSILLLGDLRTREI